MDGGGLGFEKSVPIRAAFDRSSNTCLPASLFFASSIAPSTNFYYTYAKDITISLIFKRDKFLSPRFNGKGDFSKDGQSIDNGTERERKRKSKYKICSYPFRYFISEIKHESSPEKGRKNKRKEKVSQVSFLPSIK